MNNDQGQIVRNKYSIRYLHKIPIRKWKYCLGGNALAFSQVQMESRMRQLEIQMGESDFLAEYERLLKEYDELQHQFKENGYG